MLIGICETRYSEEESYKETSYVMKQLNNGVYSEQARFCLCF